MPAPEIEQTTIDRPDPALTPPGFNDVLAAAGRIAHYSHRTPVLTCSQLDTRLGAQLFFKCDNFQKTGAFKFRGACNTIMSLDEQEISRGVVTHSSGNHAAALCHAASLRGAKATVVMPNNANAVKKAAVRSYGGTIIECDTTARDREKTMLEWLQTHNSVPVVPFDDARVIAGQGTAALEFLDQVADLDCLIAPVGGGGMLAGTVISALELKPELLVYGAEPAAADDSYQSFHAGHRCPLPAPAQTLADGLRTSIGELTFPIIQRGVRDILLASEEGIVLAMRLIWERMKIIIEPSSAVALAALLENPVAVAGRRTGVILTGGNVDVEHLPWAVG